MKKRKRVFISIRPKPWRRRRRIKNPLGSNAARCACAAAGGFLLGASLGDKIIQAIQGGMSNNLALTAVAALLAPKASTPRPEKFDEPYLKKGDKK